MNPWISIFSCFNLREATGSRSEFSFEGVPSLLTGGFTSATADSCRAIDRTTDLIVFVWRVSTPFFNIIEILLQHFAMIHFLLLFSRQGKVRLSKWYSTYTQKERAKIIKEITPKVLARQTKVSPSLPISNSRSIQLCNFLDWRDLKLVYKRYASLYFCCCVDTTDNELYILEVIHHYVEVLDRYFGNVCELDLIFNFHKAYYILDETLISGNPLSPPVVTVRVQGSCKSRARRIFRE